jgi:hypothetical protein
MAKSHTYKKYNIYPVELREKADQGYKYFVQTYHSPTGIPWDSQNCHHVHTLKQAKGYIDELIAQENYYATAQ